MENVAKDAAVNFIFFIVVGFHNAQHVTEVESQLAGKIAVDGRGREGLETPQCLHHLGILLPLLGTEVHLLLSALQGTPLDGMRTLYKELEHEA